MDLNHLDGLLSSDFPEYDFHALFAPPADYYPLDFVASSYEGTMPPSLLDGVDGDRVGRSSPSADDVATQPIDSEGAVPPTLDAEERTADEGLGLDVPSRDEDVTTENVVHPPDNVEEFGYSAPSVNQPEDLVATNATQVAGGGPVSHFPLDKSRPFSPTQYLPLTQELHDSGLAQHLIPASLAPPPLPSGHPYEAPAKWHRLDESQYHPGTDVSSTIYPSPSPSAPEDPATDYSDNTENVPPFSSSQVPSKDEHPTTEARAEAHPHYAPYHHHQPPFFVTTPASFPAVDHGSLSVPASWSATVPYHTGSVGGAPAAIGGYYAASSSEQQTGRKRKGKEVDRVETDKPAAKKSKKIAPPMAGTSTQLTSAATADGSSAPGKKNRASERPCSLAGTLDDAAARERADQIFKDAAELIRCMWPGCSSTDTISNSVNDLTQHLKHPYGPHGADPVRVSGPVVCEWPVVVKGRTQPCGKKFNTGAVGVARHLHTARHLNVQVPCPGEGCEMTFPRVDRLVKHLKGEA